MPSSATLPRRKRWRALIALLVAPTGVSLVITAVFAALTALSTREIPPLREFGIIWLGLGALMLVISLTFGLAFHAIAFRSRWRRVVTYIIAGAGFGAVGGALLTASVLLLQTQTATRDLAYMFGAAAATLLLGVVPGALSAAAFWLIRRPDRDIDRGLEAAFS